MVSSIWLDSLFGNLEIALILFFFVWLFGWAKNALGSEKLAVFFAILIVFLTAYQFRELIWLAVGVFLLATFGKELFSKIGK